MENGKSPNLTEINEIETIAKYGEQKKTHRG